MKRSALLLLLLCLLAAVSAAAEDVENSQAKDGAPVKEAGEVLIVTASRDAETVTGGHKLKFTAAFTDPEAVPDQDGYGEFTWTVTDAETGEAPAFAEISEKGVLSVSRDLDRAAELEVTAASVSRGISGSCRVTAVPALKGLAAEPAELLFYTGITPPVKLGVRPVPEAAQLEGVTLAVTRKGVVRTVEDGYGDLLVIPVGGGETEIHVKSGGKTARVKVTVADPVTAVKISAKGKAVPGGTVSLGVKLTPARPAVPDVVWSVDTDGDVVPVLENGRLQIPKDAAEGTVIQVTCTALGAPEPVSQTIEITVAKEKK